MTTMEMLFTEVFHMTLLWLLQVIQQMDLIQIQMLKYSELLFKEIIMLMWTTSPHKTHIIIKIMDKKVNMVILKVLVMVLLTLLINQDQFLIINTVTLMILIQKTTTYTMDQTIIKMELMTTLHLIINHNS
jgi:hypothetical protein